MEQRLVQQTLETVNKRRKTNPIMDDPLEPDEPNGVVDRHYSFSPWVWALVLLLLAGGTIWLLSKILEN